MITILGAGGFIGTGLAKRLQEKNIPFTSPAKGKELDNKMGHVIYCIGLTADFRRKPFETVEAHVCLLNKILEKGNFESLTYLSSTRVYIKSKEKEVYEHSPIEISIDDPDELYTLTKLTGERICLSSGRKVKVARLSNVYGDDQSSENFITDIIRKIKADKYIKLFTTPDSAKDYISINSVADLLLSISIKGEEKIYNVASGENISNQDILDILKEKYEFDFEFDPGAKRIVFPAINTDKIIREFGYSKTDNRKHLSQLIKIQGNDTN